MPPDTHAPDLLLVLALLASVALGGGLPLSVALGRERRLERAFRQADIASLARHLSSAGEPAAPLRSRLDRASPEELKALGDAALESPHPTASRLFDLVFEILERRNELEREAARRRERWRELELRSTPEISDAPSR